MVCGTFKQAQTYLGTLLSSLDQQTFVPPAKQNLREFLGSWLDTTASQKVSAATLRSYRERLKAVDQRIGHLKLDRVAPQTLQALYKALQEDLKYSPRTIRYTHTVLSQAFKKAVAWRVLSHNPCDNVTLPKKEGIGHASIVITLDTYSHVLPDMQDEVVAKLGMLTAGSSRT